MLIRHHKVTPNSTCTYLYLATSSWCG